MAFDFPAAYDELNPSDQDHLFYSALAQELGASRVIDLGCGTGTLARLLDADGIAVVGIDPDPEMIHVAQAKAGGNRVDWRLGYSDRVDTSSADLAVMSGHVAQVFLDDEGWSRTLADLHRGLVSGGALAFESRSPDARAWEDWTRGSTLRTVDTAEGPVEFWHEVVAVELPLVTYDTLTRNLRTGEATRTRDVLAFRDLETLTTSLEEAGFEVSSVFGDWSRTQPSPASPELIVIASRC